MESDAREQALRRLKAQRAFRNLLVTAAGILVVMIAIWAISGGGYFWPIWPMLGWGIGVLADAGRLGRPCRRRSSNPGSSTAKLPSSAAAAPGSGEPLR